MEGGGGGGVGLNQKPFHEGGMNIFWNSTLVQATLQDKQQVELLLEVCLSHAFK